MISLFNGLKELRLSFLNNIKLIKPLNKKLNICDHN